MITFIGEEKLNWEQIKNLPLRPEIDSPEKFDEAIAAGCTRALERLQGVLVSPGRLMLKEIHDLIFVKVLENGPCFRTNGTWVSSKDGMELCPAHEIKKRIQVLQSECRHFMEKPTYHEKTEPHRRVPATNREMVETLSRFHSELMKIWPFEDDLGNPFINRTIAAVILESQLEHCFNKDRINRKVNADRYKNALRHSHEFASDERLRNLVTDLAGDGYKVHSIDRHRERLASEIKERVQEHDRSR